MTPLHTSLSALLSRPGGGSAAVRVGRRLSTARASGSRALQQRAAALRALDIADDPRASLEARRGAALEALCCLSCAAFWSAPASTCHEVGAAYDARLLDLLGRELG